MYQCEACGKPCTSAIEAKWHAEDDDRNTD